MAALDIQPLAPRLSDSEIRALSAALERVAAPALPAAKNVRRALALDAADEHALDEMLDRLETVDAACDLYLPIPFDGRLSVGDRMVGSTHSLLEALAELKEELALLEDDDEDDFGEGSVSRAELHGAFRLFHDAAVESLERALPLHVLG